LNKLLAMIEIGEIFIVHRRIITPNELPACLATPQPDACYRAFYCLHFSTPPVARGLAPENISGTKICRLTAFRGQASSPQRSSQDLEHFGNLLKHFFFALLAPV